MSGSGEDITNSAGPASGGVASSGGEPSMEEILASIRRILKDEQSGESVEPGEEPEDEDILVLDPSMEVRPLEAFPEPASLRADPLPEARREDPVIDGPEMAFTLDPDDFGAEPPPAAEPEVHEPQVPEPVAEAPAVVLTDTGVAGSASEILMEDEQNVQPPHGLVSDTASEAAASSIGSLIRSISSERSIALGRPGLTLEDIVREELRPLLKSWLDSNLPALVERIVRAEIQRVVERTGI